MINPRGFYIEGRELLESDVDSRVTYVPLHARENGDCSHRDAESGYIRSWNDGGVFVQYAASVARTNFSDLVWG